MQATRLARKCKRGERNMGRLYIRLKGGKQLKAGASNWDTGNGCYYLEYWEPNGKNDAAGKPIKKKKRVALLDEQESPITTLAAAEVARERIIRQYVAADKAERLARVKAELEEAETLKQQAQDEANPPLRLADAWHAFADHPKLDCGETLLYNYRGHWNQFTEWLRDHDPEAVYMRDVSKPITQDYARHLNQRKVSPGTYNKHVNFLKLVFSILKDEIRAEYSPFEELATKKLSKAKAKAQARSSKRRELTRQELLTVLDMAEGDLQTLLMLGSYTGLRLGDCCTLKWNEVDLERGMVRRVPNKTQGNEIKIGLPPRLVRRLAETPNPKRKGYVLPKFAEDYTYDSGKGKNSRRTRITNRIQKHFEETCGITTHAEGTGYRMEPDPDRDGEFIRVHSGKRAIVEVGFHSLRHTFVSMQAERGIPLSTVQAIVGHGSPAMTAHYTHVSDKAALDATLLLDDGAQDAEFELLSDSLPVWARELAERLDGGNWQEIKAALQAQSRPEPDK